jgi:hypothetical protein
MAAAQPADSRGERQMLRLKLNSQGVHSRKIILGEEGATL